MANRDRRAQYVASEVLKSIIQIKDDSEFEILTFQVKRETTYLNVLILGTLNH